MSNIKPIETNYKGHRFRSRLEARWAVFFDSLGIKYEYEEEGFKINEYHKTKTWWYLPDFYLPKTKTWIEVKSSLEEVDVDYWNMIANAVDWGGQIPNVEDSGFTERGILFLSGLHCPRDGMHMVYPCVQHYKGVIVSLIKFTSKGLYSEVSGVDHSDASWGGNDPGNKLRDMIIKHSYLEASGIEDARVLKAVKRAKSARFEYGENG